MAARKPIDWQALEREYRIGQLSLRALAEKHGCTAAAISQRAKKYDWVKDATQEVRERTRAALIGKLSKLDAGEELNALNTVNNPTHEDVQIAVATNITIVRAHRKDIRTAADLVSLLMGQLMDAAQSREELEATVDDETEGDTNGMRRAKLKRALSLPTHAATIRDLTTAAKNLVTLERQAYNLDEASGEETYEQRLSRLMGRE